MAINGFLRNCRFIGTGKKVADNVFFCVHMQKMYWSPKAIDLLSGNNIYLKNLSSCYQMSLGDKLQKKKQICM
jgi:hypothetical protein